MVAVPLLFGRLTADDYSDAVAADPRIDALRDKMTVSEDPRFTRDYSDPAKRYIGNSVQVFFKDGTHTQKITVDVPIGHRERRAEGIPVLMDKFERAMRGRLSAERAGRLMTLANAPTQLESLAVTDFMDLFSN